MMGKTFRLLVLSGVLGLLLATQAGALEPYCCVCTACTTGSAVQCVPAEAQGVSTAGCPTACADAGCGRSRTVDGVCPAPDACADLIAPAPTLSWQALSALALALTAWGVYGARRRLHS